MIRPCGRPPIPSAMSNPRLPVEVASISITGLSEPSFMIEPLPNCRSICASALSNAFALSISRFPFKSSRFAAAMFQPLIPQPQFRGNQLRDSLRMGFSCGVLMLVFWEERLVLLATPKNGTTSIAKALESRAAISIQRPPELKHTPIKRFRRFIGPYLEQVSKEPFTVIGVMREPRDWLGSWYRYRQRPGIPA